MSFRAVAMGIFGALLLVDSADAQPKRGRPVKAPVQKEAPAPEKTDKSSVPEPEKTGVPGEAPTQKAATPTASGDLGEAPPAAAESGATKLSPLTPRADEFPSGVAPAPPPDLDRLLGEITALRSRVAALTTTLFKSKLRIVVETRDESARIDSLGVTLDDGVVFAAPDRFDAEDGRVVYEHAVAPGQHVIGLEVERYDAQNRQFRSWQSSRFSVVVPESQLVEADFVIEEDSSMASDFPADGDGEYELKVRLRARVSP